MKVVGKFASSAVVKLNKGKEKKVMASVTAKMNKKHLTSHLCNGFPGGCVSSLDLALVKVSAPRQQSLLGTLCRVIQSG